MLSLLLKVAVISTAVVVGALVAAQIINGQEPVHESAQHSFTEMSRFDRSDDDDDDISDNSDDETSDDDTEDKTEAVVVASDVQNASTKLRGRHGADGHHSQTTVTYFDDVAARKDDTDTEDSDGHTDGQPLVAVQGGSMEVNGGAGDNVVVDGGQNSQIDSVDGLNSQSTEDATDTENSVDDDDHSSGTRSRTASFSDLGDNASELSENSDGYVKVGH